MKKLLISYSFIIFWLLILDGIWLSIMLPTIYKQNLSHLLSETINYFPAVIFYLIYSFGIYFFIIKSANERNLSILTVFFYGFLFGVICYSTYDLTNQATLKNWPVIVTIIDIFWGGLLTSLCSVFTFLILKKI